MVRLRTTDDFCCELNINATSYNLKNIKCSQLNNDFEVKITSLDLTNSAKNGDLISNAIYLHNKNENAHNTLFKSLKDKNNLQDIEIGKKINQSDLASVAISGSYADLINSPSIPADTSDLTNNAGFITSANIPTKTSDLTNHSGFITDVSNKANISADNFSNSGKSVIANLSMPSNTYAVITQADSYTAPSNGWFEFMGTTDVVNGYVWGSNNVNGYYQVSYAAAVNYTVCVIIPAKTGDVISGGFGGAHATGLRFIYAKGSESEV